MNAAEFPPIRTAGEHVDTPDDALKVETSGFPHALSEPASETEESFLQVPRRTKVCVRYMNKGITVTNPSVAGNLPRKKTLYGRLESRND